MGWNDRLRSRGTSRVERARDRLARKLVLRRPRVKGRDARARVGTHRNATSPRGRTMKCPACQTENSRGQRFCGQCGVRLAATCAACGAANDSGQKFCGQCGAPLAVVTGTPKFGPPESYTPRHLAEKILTSKAALEGERKQVTVLFADLKGSMELLAERD